MSAKNKKTPKKLLWILLAAVAVLLVVLLIPANKGETAAETMAATQPVEQEETQPAQLFLLKECLRIDEIGEYTGIYVEDGSDEPVTGLLMMLVTNVSNEPVQYAQISLDLDGETAQFTVSALPAKGTAVLIEQNRMEYSEDFDYTTAAAECINLAGYDRKLSLQEDKLQIQLLDGGVNIKNISGADINETIILYYKNINNGVYHGGITYRVRLEDGLKADELRQIMVDHIHQPGTELMFVDLIA